MPNKICIEATLISARGLRRSSSSLWKRHWFAVGWIDPNSKYCTSVSKDGSSTPTWKTKFAALLDESSLDSAAVTVEVYSREPIFLRETLEGTATILLKEFVLKYHDSRNKGSSSSSSGGVDEVGSYQLRKRSSNRSQGLVDVSIRVTDQDSGDHSGSSSYNPGAGEGIVLKDYHGNNQPQMYPLAPFQHPQNPTSTSAEFTHQMPYPAAYHHPARAPSYLPATGPAAPPGPGNQGSYQTMPRPPHPPPSHPPAPNMGYYTPTFVPNSGYINMPASAASVAHGSWSGRPTASNLAAGAGVGGALAAGAMIYGDDVMSAFSSIPSQVSSLPAISLDPPFL